MSYGRSKSRLPIHWLWQRLSTGCLSHLQGRLSAEGGRTLEQFEKFIDRHQALFASRWPMTLEQANDTVEWHRPDPHVARLLLTRMERKLSADGNSPPVEFYQLAIKLVLVTANNEMKRGDYFHDRYWETENTLIAREGGTPCLPRFSSSYSDF